MSDIHVIENLYNTIVSRKKADPDRSYTAKLFQRGRGKIAQKLGEEAVEAVIEAMRGDKRALAEESADMLYHLLVTWVDVGVEPADVWAVIEDRMGVSGVTEKRSRKGGD